MKARALEKGATDRGNELGALVLVGVNAWALWYLTPCTVHVDWTENTFYGSKWSFGTLLEEWHLGLYSMTQLLFIYCWLSHCSCRGNAKQDMIYRFRSSLKVWSDADSCAIICMALNWNADFVNVKPIRNNWLVAFVFLKRWDWKVLCTYLPQPLIPASTMCVCIDMCVRMSVGQSECQ